MYFFVMPAIKLYWRIFKPQSYGVKVVIIHPSDSNQILLVRHSYGNTALWNIPGGGYKPKKETGESAARREINEELNVEILGLEFLGEYQTTGEGKKDTVTLFRGTIQSPEKIQINSEIAEIDWVDIHSAVNRGNDVARVARHAMKQVISSTLV